MKFGYTYEKAAEALQLTGTFAGAKKYLLNVAERD